MKKFDLTKKLKGLITLSPIVKEKILVWQRQIFFRHSQSRWLQLLSPLIDRLKKISPTSQITKIDLLLIPNLMSALRLTIIPLFVLGYWLEASAWFYLISYLLLMTFDLFDGPIARECHLSSDLGKVLDPLADKIAHISMMIIGTFVLNIIPWWFTFIGIMRELVLIFFFSKIPDQSGSQWWGKIGAFWQTIQVTVAFLLISLCQVKIPPLLYLLLLVFHVGSVIAYFLPRKKKGNE